MYKKLLLIAAVVLSLCVVPYANADRPSGVSRSFHLWVASDNDTAAFTVGENDAWIGEDFGFGGTFYPPAGSVDATAIADVVRYYQLPLMSFVLYNTSSSIVNITSSTGIPIEYDDYIPNITWADGETSPIGVTFRVPDDYSSGGAFKLLATESDSTTPNQVDFEVYINSDGTAADSSATNQTPVALAGDTGTPDEVTLTVATDFASLAAGNWVTLKIWRDDTADGTGDLEFKGGSFYYTATQ